MIIPEDMDPEQVAATLSEFDAAIDIVIEMVTLKTGGYPGDSPPDTYIDDLFTRWEAVDSTPALCGAALLVETVHRFHADMGRSVWPDWGTFVASLKARGEMQWEINPEGNL